VAVAHYKDEGAQLLHRDSNKSLERKKINKYVCWFEEKLISFNHLKKNTALIVSLKFS
jgi:hypothetical protein